MSYYSLVVHMDYLDSLNEQLATWSEFDIHAVAHDNEGIITLATAMEYHHPLLMKILDEAYETIPLFAPRIITADMPLSLPQANRVKVFYDPQVRHGTFCIDARPGSIEAAVHVARSQEVGLIQEGLEREQPATLAHAALHLYRKSQGERTTVTWQSTVGPQSVTLAATNPYVCVQTRMHNNSESHDKLDDLCDVIDAYVHR